MVRMRESRAGRLILDDDSDDGLGPDAEDDFDPFEFIKNLPAPPGPPAPTGPPPPAPAPGVVWRWGGGGGMGWQHIAASLNSLAPPSF